MALTMGQTSDLFNHIVWPKEHLHRGNVLLEKKNWPWVLKTSWYTRRESISILSQVIDFSAIDYGRMAKDHNVLEVCEHFWPMAVLCVFCSWSLNLWPGYGMKIIADWNGCSRRLVLKTWCFVIIDTWHGWMSTFVFKASVWIHIM